MTEAFSGSDASQFDITLHPQVYQRLRWMARSALAAQANSPTLNTTALVHEAWLNLTEGEAAFESREHFFAYAATAMRHILIDRARSRLAQKRGGGEAPLHLAGLEIPVDHAAAELLALDGALERLDALEPRLARVVELRFFAGLTVDETATVLGVVSRSVVRDWARARVFLQRALT